MRVDGQPEASLAGTIVFEPVPAQLDVEALAGKTQDLSRAGAVVVGLVKGGFNADPLNDVQ